MSASDLPKGPPILSIDFDGVIHSYTSGWKGPRNIPDEPVPGAIQWLRDLVDDQRDPFAPRFRQFDVRIFSSRSRYLGGRTAMKAYLIRHGMRPGEVEAIGFPLLKPPSHLLIDDRAMQFTGVFPSPRTLLRFKPWNRVEKNNASPNDPYLFRKLPVTIEAWQWNFSKQQLENPGWVNEAMRKWPATGGAAFFPDGTYDQAGDPHWYNRPHIAILTPEGRMRASPGDWIIRGVQGEIYPCKPDIFAQTYEKI